MTFTDMVRGRLQVVADTKTWAELARETDIPYSCLYTFLRGGGLRSDSLDKIVVYLKMWDAEHCVWSG